MKKNYYKVAGHVFGVTAGTDDLELMTNYQPFLCEGGQSVFTLIMSEGEAVAYTEEMRQDDEGQQIICGKTNGGQPVFEFVWWKQTAGWLVCSPDYRVGQLILTGRQRKLAIDNALMILFALSTASQSTVLFHAAVVSLHGHGYMFLGKSGTGKSTHAGLWVRHIEGVRLLNDDNPVVRLIDGQAVVYGSPWSGKTPCYRNEQYPLGGIVQLSQAPYNKIEPLKGLAAYAALTSSISGMRWDRRIADGLHATEDALASSIPVWHLECLPDDEAARLCRLTIDN